MTENTRCPNCGTELNDQGLCPACLLRLGMTCALPKLSESPAEQAEPSLSAAPSGPRFRGLRWISVSFSAMLLIAVGIALRRSPEKQAPVLRFTLPLGEDGDF